MLKEIIARISLACLNSLKKNIVKQIIIWDSAMTDHPYKKLAQILVDHSTNVQPGDRVAIETTTNASSIVSEIYELVLLRGGHPHVLSISQSKKSYFSNMHKMTS